MVSREKAAMTLSIAVLIVVGVAFQLFLWPWRPVTVQPPAFQTTVVDDFGREVTLSKVPQRIISLAPSNTEILFALGLGTKTIGVTKYCDYPPEVLERVKKGDAAVIGGFADPSIERIVALNPDLVLAASTLQEKVVKDLEEKGFTVIVLNPNKVDQILAGIRLVGKICGELARAQNLTDHMQRVIDTVVSKTKNVAYRPRVYYEVWYEPLHTIGPGTWQNELIKMAGGVNIFADAKAPYPIVSPESVIERNPEIIIVPIGYMGGAKTEDFEKRPGWKVISAVKNGRICQMDENTVIRPGPRIVQGLQQLAKLIHPEIFGSSCTLSPVGVGPLQIILRATLSQKGPCEVPVPYLSS